MDRSTYSRASRIMKPSQLITKILRDNEQTAAKYGSSPSKSRVKSHESKNPAPGSSSGKELDVMFVNDHALPSNRIFRPQSPNSTITRNGRSQLFRNESVQFFSNLKMMYSSGSGFPSYQESSAHLTSSETGLLRAQHSREGLTPQFATNFQYNYNMDHRNTMGSDFSNPLGQNWTSAPAATSFNRNSLRNWETTNLGRMLGPNNPDRLVDDGVRFTVMSYNVLSPKLMEAHDYLYEDCDPEALNWENRLKTFFAEIEFYKPDIISLQEIEASLLIPVYDREFRRLGYNGVYKKRTRDKDDGCAIFYRESKFRLLDKLSVEFHQPHVPILNRDNIAILIKLQTKRGRKLHKLIVGTTHLLYNPKRQDVKLAQTQLLLAELDRFAFCGMGKNNIPIYHPTILTGDFNTEPYSPISRLMTEGLLPLIDENGQVLKFMSRRGADEFIPHYFGISDQCQHYQLVHGRLVLKKEKKSNFFELDTNASKVFTNVVSSEDSTRNTVGDPDSPQIMSVRSSNTAYTAVTTSVTKIETSTSQNTKVSYSEASVNTNYTTYSTQFFGEESVQNIPKAPANVIDRIINATTCDIDATVLERVLKTGTLCTFGSGEFSHKFYFKDAYGSKLDRERNNEGVASTKQNGWVCVDYIYYSNVWNDKFEKQIEGKLKLVRRLGLLSRSQCKEIGSIPRLDIPSDHYPLIAEFIIKN